MDMTVILGLHKFSLQATRDHHGPSMYSGHTASINCRKRTFYCNDSKITEFDGYQKLIYCLCGNVQIDSIMAFGLEQKDGSFDYSHGAGTSSPSH